MTTESEQAAQDYSLPGAGESTDIDQVRNLLFGGYNQEYDRRFRAIERRLEESLLSHQRLVERVNQNQAEGEEKAYENHRQLQTRLEETQHTLDERLRDQRRYLDQQLEVLQTSLRKMIDTLDNQKLDQEQLADLLVDLGMRLKRGRIHSTVQQPSANNPTSNGLSNT